MKQGNFWSKHVWHLTDSFLFHSNLPGLPKTWMVWQPFQLGVVAIFIPGCYHVYMHLYVSLDVFWGSVARATLPPLLQLRNLPNWMVKRYFAVATSHGYNLKNWRKSSVSWVANVWFCLVIRIFVSQCFTLSNHIKKKQCHSQTIRKFWHSYPLSIFLFRPHAWQTSYSKDQASSWEALQRWTELEQQRHREGLCGWSFQVETKTPLLGQPTIFGYSQWRMLMFLVYSHCSI